MTQEQKYQNKLAKAKVCSICYKQYDEFGNNAQPINTGTCCDKCNSLVIMARLSLMATRKLIK